MINRIRQWHWMTKVGAIFIVIGLVLIARSATAQTWGGLFGSSDDNSTPSPYVFMRTQTAQTYANVLTSVALGNAVAGNTILVDFSVSGNVITYTGTDPLDATIAFSGTNTGSAESSVLAGRLYVNGALRDQSLANYIEVDGVGAKSAVTTTLKTAITLNQNDTIDVRMQNGNGFAATLHDWRIEVEKRN